MNGLLIVGSNGAYAYFLFKFCHISLAKAKIVFTSKVIDIITLY